MPNSSEKATNNGSAIKPIDALSAHRITSGQVVIDLQTAVKELVENSLDASATTIEVRFKNYGLDSIEVVDNGIGIAPADYDAVALKHHTSKLSSFSDLTSVTTFGFRGEALSSLCALSSSVTVLTATADETPMGTILEFDKQGKISSKGGRAARQRGTTVTISGLFKPLPVRRKEFERNAKREFGKALHLLSAYALIPCAQENGGVRLTCSNQIPAGKKTVQLRTDGTPSVRASVSALWGPKTLDHLDTLDLCFEVQTEKSVLRRLQALEHNVDYRKDTSNEVRVRGVVSKFILNCGRATTDRQFLYVNGRPCQSGKVQKAFNEVYRTFNATQSPLVIADFVLPPDSLDINVSPDKRTIFIHSEDNLVAALKDALEQRFAPKRSTYDVRNAPKTQEAVERTEQPQAQESADQAPCEEPQLESSQGLMGDIGRSDSDTTRKKEKEPLFLADEEDNTMPTQTHVIKSTSTMATDPCVSQDPEADRSPFGERILLIEPSIPVEEEDGSSADVMDVDPEVISASTTHAHHDSRPESFDPGNHATFETERVHDIVLQGPTTNEGQHLPKPASSGEGTIHQIAPPRTSSRSSGSSTVSSASSIRVVSASNVNKRNAGQMTLNTSGAAWSLQLTEEAGADAQRLRKRPRTSEGEQRVEKVKGKQAFRSLLAGYVLPGSQVQPGAGDSEYDDDDDDDDMDEEPAQKDENASLPLQDPKDTMIIGNPGGARPDNVSTPRSTAVTSSDSAASDLVSMNISEVGTDSFSALNATDQGKSPNNDKGSNSEDVSMSEDHTEIMKSGSRETVVMRFDMNATETSWNRFRGHRPSTSSLGSRARTKDADLVAGAGLANTDDSSRADEVLSRVIEKDDFEKMDVIGQFNLGFIVVRRLKESNDVEMDDLFIVDQHAADEKYNFETLQLTTKIESQKLFRPIPLELAAGDELIALDNLDVLRQNGFEVEEAEAAADDIRQARLRVVAQPVSKSTVFDMRDLEELIHLMHDQPTGQMVRCTKARSMFAMRACRKSIMIGMPLTIKQMTSVVRHMSSMDQPWNCPHGRPTMRHLSDISSLGRDHRKEKALDWRSVQAALTKA